MGLHEVFPSPLRSKLVEGRVLQLQDGVPFQRWGAASGGSRRHTGRHPEQEHRAGQFGVAAGRRVH
eukprot:14984409-Alexandrium_andersonii.AAC.1